MGNKRNQEHKELPSHLDTKRLPRTKLQYFFALLGRQQKLPILVVDERRKAYAQTQSRFHKGHLAQHIVLF